MNVMNIAKLSNNNCVLYNCFMFFVCSDFLYRSYMVIDFKQRLTIDLLCFVVRFFSFLMLDNFVCRCQRSAHTTRVFSASASHLQWTMACRCHSASSARRHLLMRAWSPSSWRNTSPRFIRNWPRRIWHTSKSRNTSSNGRDWIMEQEFSFNLATSSRNRTRSPFLLQSRGRYTQCRRAKVSSLSACISTPFTE